MALHSTLTGADLHESKGVDSAAANTIYIANGSGSGVWTKLTASAVDTTTIKNVNIRKFPVLIKNIGTAQSFVLPITDTCTLTKVTAILAGAITTSNIAVSVLRNGSLSAGTVNLLFSGSAKGSQFSLTPASNNSFVATDWIELASGGGTGAVDCTFLLEFTLS